MNQKLKIIGAVSFVVAVISLLAWIQIWRIRQFQKATGFGFIKAAVVLGK